MRKILFALAMSASLAAQSVMDLTVEDLSWERESGNQVAIRFVLHNYANKESKNHRVRVEFLNAQGNVVAASQELIRDHCLSEHRRQFKIKKTLPESTFSSADSVRVSIVDCAWGSF